MSDHFTNKDAACFFWEVWNNLEEDQFPISRRRLIAYGEDIEPGLGDYAVEAFIDVPHIPARVDVISKEQIATALITSGGLK